jgi:hypothetical protein
MTYKSVSLTLHLVGKAPNQLAIGARATVIVRNHRMIAEVRSGGSYLSQNDLRLRFGLGAAPMAEAVEVRWANGHVDAWKALPAGAIVTLQNGGKLVSTVPYRAFPARLQP